MKFIEVLIEFAGIANFFLLIFVLLSLWQNWVLQKKQFKFEKSKLFIEEKKEVYLKFLDFLHKTTKGEKMTETDMMKSMNEFTDKIRTYGDADVVDTWHRFMKEVSSVESESKDDDTKTNVTFREGERFLRALRKNMGHNDSKLLPGSIFATHIVEHEKHLAFEACKDEKYKWLNDD